MKKSKCIGCYNNAYNHGLGGAIECWHFRSAKIVWCKEVSLDQRPPWRQKARRFPHCYRKPGYIYVSPRQKPRAEASCASCSCSAWVAFLSDGQRAFPVCTAESEKAAKDEGCRLVGEKDAYFISVYQVPNATNQTSSGAR